MKALLERPKLEDHPFMAEASSEFIQEIAKAQEEVSLMPGQVLFHKGGYADNFYLLLEGEVEIYLEGCDIKGNEHVLTLGEGDLVGWSWLYPPYCWHFSARVKKQVKALRVHAPSLLIAAETNHDFGYELMKRLSRNLLRRLDALSKVLEHQRRC